MGYLSAENIYRGIMMKVTIFNSWQSDLPNNKNRGFIENALQKAKKRVLEDNRNISEIEIISDSRGEEVPQT